MCLAYMHIFMATNVESKFIKFPEKKSYFFCIKILA